MKLRLGLVLLFSLSLLTGQVVLAQTTEDPVVFYSKGKMHVKFGSNATGSSSASTTLYIKGSAEFSSGSGVVQKGRTELTGDFINSKDPSQDTEAGNSGYTKLFAAPETTENAGVIAFIGKDNNQTIKRAASLITKYEQKTSNFIDFPTLRVEKTVTNATTANPRAVGSVIVDTSAAVRIQYLEAPLNASNVLGTNRFVVKASYGSSNVAKFDFGLADIVKVGTNTDLPGYSQVDFAMYKYDGISDDGAIDAATHKPAATATNNTLRRGGKNYLTGFTPPFKQMAADYLFYHVLMKPNQYSLTSNGGTIVNPSYLMEAGKGYFMSMDVSDYRNAEINSEWQHEGLTISNANRARGTLELNRRLMRQYFDKANASDIAGVGTTYMKDFSRYTADAGDEEIGGGMGSEVFGDDANRVDLLKDETFNVGEVAVLLEEGLNFLGNPFMAPISLNPLLGYNPDGTSMGDLTAGSGVDLSTYFGAGIKSATSPTVSPKTLRPMYWVINNGLIEFKDNKYYMSVTYDYVSNDGSTLTSGHYGLTADDDRIDSDEIENPLNFLIAPMQMFLVEASDAFEIKLQPALKKLGHTTRFLKSGNNNDLLSDFFVAEVTNSEDNLSDRTAIVLRDAASMSSDLYDATKNLSNSIVLPEEKKNDRIYPEETSSYIYTKSSSGTKMLGNAVPLNVKELALFVTPPATQRSMKLNFYNLDNLTSVSNVWLIDRYQNNKTVKLTPGYSYEFTSGPSDLKDVEENRFILRFYGDGDGDIIKEDTPITCYYNTSVLHILGLNENDIDSDVQVYDMQGRLMGKTKVNNYPSMEYVKPLSLGTYIVKISGNRNFTTKFVNLQN